MADVLVMNQSSADTIRGWQLGQVVDIFPDGRLGPGIDQHPKFWVIRVPNATVEELQFLMEAPVGTEPILDPVGGDVGMRKAIGRRRDGFDTAKISAPVLAELQTNREITVPFTAAQIQTYITRFWPDAT